MMNVYIQILFFDIYHYCSDAFVDINSELFDYLKRYATTNNFRIKC